MEKSPKDAQNAPYEEILTVEEIEARFPGQTIPKVLTEHPEIGLKLTTEQIAQINAIKDQANYHIE